MNAFNLGLSESSNLAYNIGAQSGIDGGEGLFIIVDDSDVTVTTDSDETVIAG